jgi:type IV pilus assembly protein PilC
MTFKYKAVTGTGEAREGIIEAQNKDLAITALQRRGFIVTSVVEEAEKGGMLTVTVFSGVTLKDVVLMSRQIATLFEAQVSAVKAFSLLGTNAENPTLRQTLAAVVDDIQAGLSISGALGKHPKVFSEFYVNMVRAGEESGKLNQTFLYLADYLERQYELTSKTRNALIYPAFVIVVFVIVMVLMFVMVIPQLSKLIVESGQDIPMYTKVVIGISSFLVKYGIFLFIAFIAFVGYVWWLSMTERGKVYLDRVKLGLPIFGNLFTKLYLSRIADNMDTMISSGIPIVRAIEITGTVTGSRVYGDLLTDAANRVKSGSALSDALGAHEEIPQIMVQMVKVGEETGGLSSILKTVARFYKREVDDAVDSLVGMIEPIMIVVLGAGVALLLASILVQIYNTASGIS